MNINEKIFLEISISALLDKSMEADYLSHSERNKSMVLYYCSVDTVNGKIKRRAVIEVATVATVATVAPVAPMLHCEIPIE